MNEDHSAKYHFCERRHFKKTAFFQSAHVDGQVSNSTRISSIRTFQKKIGDIRFQGFFETNITVQYLTKNIFILNYYYY